MQGQRSLFTLKHLFHSPLWEAVILENVLGQFDIKWLQKGLDTHIRVIFMNISHPH